jgi:hypothetical protein
VHLTAFIETSGDRPRNQRSIVVLLDSFFDVTGRCETHLARTVPVGGNLNAIMAQSFKRNRRESADGYFCFTLEHDVVRRTPWA